MLAFGALLAMTAAWGSTFFMIKDIVTRMAVADLLAVRFAHRRARLAAVAGRQLRMSRTTLLRRGAVLGVLYGVAQILQTVGLAHTAASVSGFITGLYVVATPLLGALHPAEPDPPADLAGRRTGTVGSRRAVPERLPIGYGELLTLASAIIYAVHIVALGRLSGPGTRAESQRGADGGDHAAVCTLAALCRRGTAPGSSCRPAAATG